MHTAATNALVAFLPTWVDAELEKVYLEEKYEDFVDMVIRDHKLQAVMDEFTERVLEGVDKKKREKFNFNVFVIENASVNGILRCLFGIFCCHFFFLQLLLILEELLL